MSRPTHFSLPRLTLSILTPIVLSQAFAVTASATDMNTYRPGQAYLKTAANSHEVCAQQCQGDAQCRGWNFVRPNPRTATGICEFNARTALPVQSAISTSGEITTSVDPLMSRAIPAGTRTRRVGTPTVEVRKPATPAKRPTQVRRMPVPVQQKSLRPTTHTRPKAAAPNLRQSRTYGNEAKPAPTKTSAQPAPQQQILTPEQQYYRQQFLANRQRQEQYRAQQQAALRQQQMRRPQLVRPQAAALGLIGPQPLPQHQQTPRVAANAPQLQQQQQSLYGSLHDDLTKDMTPVARPKTAPDNLANPDAPVSTSRAAPAKPVETTPLKKPVIPGLAGAE